MSAVNSDSVRMGASGASTGYTIDQSIRFNDDDTAYLTAVLGTPTDQDVYTASFWFKRGQLGTLQYLFCGGPASTTSEDFIGIQADDTLYFRWGGTTRLVTNRKFRDPSAAYHLALACDYAASGSDKAKLYINGVEETSFSTDTRSSITTTNQKWNTATDHWFGRAAPSAAQFYDGYLSECVFIDGQQLTPTSFGEFNTSGVWIPVAYAGTYGTNGFYITGEDSADLGADYSGNSNDFTSSGLTSDDQVTDTPTDNYATLNPLDQTTTGDIGTFAEGNLQLATTVNDSLAAASFNVLEDGCYWEATISAAGDELFGLWVSSTTALRSASTSSPHTDAASCVIRVATNTVYNEGSSSSFSPATISTNDVVMFAYKNGQLFYGKNNTWENSADPAAETGELFTIASSSSKVIVPVFGRSGAGNVTYLTNFGQSGFTYTPPTGYVALSTSSIPAPAITDGTAQFQTTLYTGNGTAIGSGGLAVSQSENSTFQPDLVWIKRRDSAVEHALTDAVRGVTKELSSNDTGAEETVAEGLTTFGSSGFTVGSDASYNTNTGTYAAWQWLAANGTVSNIDGSITSTVSANTTAGFSIVSYTGNATGGATIGHGLSQAPEMVITKSRDNSTGRNWAVYHVVPGPTKYGELDNTNIFNTGSTRWNDTAPSSTVVTLGSQQTTNDSGSAMIAYCWHSVEGFSKFGSYTGNGSTDGPFIWCGFKPAFVIAKRTNSADNWVMVDSARNEYNVANLRLYPDTTNADITSTTHDFLSNGFKLRASDGGVNASGSPYIFMAFAEHPFGGDGVAPVPAH